MSKGNLIALLHALSGAGAIFVGFLTKGGFEGKAEVFKPLGLAIFAVGMLLFAFSVMVLREAFLGNVTPVTGDLVTDGPYRWIRHPLYLSMIITIVSIAVGMRSIWGLVMTAGLFLPCTVLRARLEEAELRSRFGPEWEEYAQRTSFLIPWLF